MFFEFHFSLASKPGRPSSAQTCVVPLAGGSFIGTRFNNCFFYDLTADAKYALPRLL